MIPISEGPPVHFQLGSNSCWPGLESKSGPFRGLTQMGSVCKGREIRRESHPLLTYTWFSFVFSHKFFWNYLIMSISPLTACCVHTLVWGSLLLFGLPAQVKTINWKDGGFPNVTSGRKFHLESFSLVWFILLELSKSNKTILLFF